MNTANNETLATIRMFGPLGKTFGRTHQRLVRTTHEAFRALAVTIPGFEKYMNSSRARGLTYAIYVGKKNIGADDLEFPNNGREIHIVPVSVSYTHLRAHETGRNLVCRLLLEKKKKKHSRI